VKYSLREFNEDFPDDAACIEHVFRTRFRLHQSASRKGRKGRKESLDRADLLQPAEHPLPVFISLRPLRTFA
jgi:hypothetical protein